MKCNICFEDYNIINRKPMIVIPCAHTFCLNCLDELKKHDNKCPNDREIIINQKPNYALIDLLNSNSSTDEQNKRCLEYESSTKSFNMAYFNAHEKFMEGLSLFDASKFRQAIDCFDKAIEFDYQTDKCYVKKGRSFILLEKLEDAINCFDKCISISSNCAEAFLYKGICVEEQGKAEEARKLYKKSNSISLVKHDSDSFLFKGYSLHLLNKNDDAIKYLNKSIEINPTAVAYKFKGDCFWDLNKLIEALDFYDKAIIENKKYFMGYLNKGALLTSELDRHAEAVVTLDKAIKLTPHSSAYKRKAEALFKLNQKAKAVDCYINAISCNPDDQEARNAMNSILDQEN